MSRVITFYSYKGGTGRSMALANMAWILASNDKRVLAIDWDLEAPGLHRYFHPFLTDKELSGQESQGVIDMALDFAVRAATPPESGRGLSEKWYEPHADFSKWRQRLRWPSGDMLNLGESGKGQIDFVPAGRQGPDYAWRVNHFDWHSFYEKLGGGAFFDEARSKFAAYDYVLIDSRTGVSDTSGICTVHMPDTLVVCFTLNYQSIKGALAVALSVREQRPKMRIFPVPMRIDGSEEKLLNRMKNYAASVFTPLLEPTLDAREYWYSMEVPYFARYAYAEKLALFEERSSITASTLPAMERLTAYVTADEVRTAEPLPESERARALAEFEGSEEAQIARIGAPTAFGGSKFPSAATPRALDLYIEEAFVRRREAAANTARFNDPSGRVIYVHARARDEERWEKAVEELCGAGYAVLPAAPEPETQTPQQANLAATERVRTLSACDGLLLVPGNDPLSFASDLVVVGHQWRNSARVLARRPLPCAVIDQGQMAGDKVGLQRSANSLRIDWIDAAVIGWTEKVGSWLNSAAGRSVGGP